MIDFTDDIYDTGDEPITICKLIEILKAAKEKYGDNIVVTNTDSEYGESAVTRVAVSTREKTMVFS